MKIVLKELPPETRGIYGPRKNVLADRMRFLHPFAAESIALIEENGVKLHFSDMFRSPEASLMARRHKKGVQPPGYSGHNFGFSVDIDVRRAIRDNRWASKEEMDGVMGLYGWMCHRKDDKLKSECWHYNYLGEEDLLSVPQYLEHSRRDRSTARALEAKIQAHYGTHFEYDVATTQRLLARIRIYNGEVDGQMQALTREAVRVFQRAWGLRDSGIPDMRTQRVLAVVTADFGGSDARS